MELNFRFDWVRQVTPGDRSGFDLGHVTIIGSYGEIGTFHKRTPQTAMLYPTIVELIDTVRKLHERKLGVASVVATGTSFEIYFRKVKSDYYEISSNGKCIAQMSIGAIIQSLLHSIHIFQSANQSVLVETDPMYEDFMSALATLETLNREVNQSN